MTFKNNIIQDERIALAKRVLSNFLKQSESDIFCTLLTGGSEYAALIKCTYLSTAYVVKFFKNKEVGKNEIAWTLHAYDLGIGPKVYYFDGAGLYILIECVKGNSLVPATANTPSVIKSIATSVARLHNSTAPSGHFSDIFKRIDEKYKKLHSAGALKDILGSGLKHVKKIQKQLQNLTIVSAPCHNDLNWGNIFVHNERVTLIDWGDGEGGNPYYDIAAFFVLNLVEEENQKLFFQQYDSKLLNSQWQSCMQLYKQLVHFEFALNLLLGVQMCKKELLYMDHAIQVNHISYYLTLLAKQEIKNDGDFLYSTAVASLNASKKGD